MVLDEIFGYKNFESQVIWQRVTGHMDSQSFGFNHDMILHYVKTENSYVWNKQYAPYDESYLLSHYQNKDENGRRYELESVS